MYPEARNNRRYPVHGRFSGASKTAIQGDLLDLSPTGLCLSTTTEVERGQVLHLEFELPTGPVELVAEVRWSTPGKGGKVELGLRIVRIPEASLQAIREATTERNRTSRPLRLPIPS
ncbi:MAG: PilZ domain-containing protein [Myxococcales bacterium]|nr:PilZ domain-containing protein [Myxococcales bacterium]